MYQIIKILPFVEANVAKCMCPKCPVQSKSTCAMDKMKVIKKALQEKPLKKESIPGVYCSSGTATCTDLNPNMSCICGICSVFAEYKLAGLSSIGFYCKNGAAQ